MYSAKNIAIHTISSTVDLIRLLYSNLGLMSRVLACDLCRIFFVQEIFEDDPFGKL
jgi:hypothetical protein